jgi:hypothetical protein
MFSDQYDYFALHSNMGAIIEKQEWVCKRLSSVKISGLSKVIDRTKIAFSFILNKEKHLDERLEFLETNFNALSGAPLFSDESERQQFANLLIKTICDNSSSSFQDESTMLAFIYHKLQGLHNKAAESPLLSIHEDGSCDHDVKKFEFELIETTAVEEMSEKILGCLPKCLGVNSFEELEISIKMMAEDLITNLPKILAKKDSRAVLRDLIKTTNKFKSIFFFLPLRCMTAELLDTQKIIEETRKEILGIVFQQIGLLSLPEEILDNIFNCKLSELMKISSTSMKFYDYVRNRFSKIVGFGLAGEQPTIAECSNNLFKLAVRCNPSLLEHSPIENNLSRVDHKFLKQKLEAIDGVECRVASLNSCDLVHILVDHYVDRNGHQTLELEIEQFARVIIAKHHNLNPLKDIKDVNLKIVEAYKRALAHGDIYVLMLMAKIGYEIDFFQEVALKGSQECTVLSLAIFHENLDFLRFLKSNSVDFSQQDQFGLSPISYAVKFSSKKMLEALHEMGADLNQADRDEVGLSPLHRAILSADQEVAHYLLDNGADCDYAEGNQAFNVLHLSVICNSPLELVARITQSMKSINAVTRDGFTCLHLALEYSLAPFKMVEYLLKAGADSNLLLPTGATLVQFALTKFISEQEGNKREDYYNALNLLIEKSRLSQQKKSYYKELIIELHPPMPLRPTREQLLAQFVNSFESKS